MVVFAVFASMKQSSRTRFVSGRRRNVSCDELSVQVVRRIRQPGLEGFAYIVTFALVLAANILLLCSYFLITLSGTRMHLAAPLHPPIPVVRDSEAIYTANVTLEQLIIRWLVDPYYNFWFPTFPTVQPMTFDKKVGGSRE